MATATAGLATTALQAARCEPSPTSTRATPPSPPLTEDVSLPTLPPLRHLGEGRSAPHFSVFTSDGEPTDVAAVLAAAQNAEVVLIGETHDDPVAHQLELLLLISLHKARGCALSLEMFEWDVQHVVDEYLSGLIREKDFLMDSRPWLNYERDYRPMLEFAKFAKLPVLAANAPRRYVGAVGRGGPKVLDASLWPSVSLGSYLPPLPLPMPSDGYMEHLLSSPAVIRVDQLQIGAGSGAGGAEAGATKRQPHTAQPHTAQPHSAQASDGGGGCPYIGLSRRDQLVHPILLWDASMAAAIARQLGEEPGRAVFHVCGSFHCEGHHGIGEMLEHYRPGTRKLVVAIYPEVFCFSPTAPISPMCRTPLFSILTVSSCLPIRRATAIASGIGTRALRTLWCSPMRGSHALTTTSRGSRPNRIRNPRSSSNLR